MAGHGYSYTERNEEASIEYKINLKNKIVKPVILELLKTTAWLYKCCFSKA